MFLTSGEVAALFAHDGVQAIGHGGPGPSGCGKSTLLKLLLGWLPDYGGSIRFDGKDAKDFTPEQLQQQMSYIEQNVFLFNSTTFRSGVRWWLIRISVSSGLASRLFSTMSAFYFQYGDHPILQNLSLHFKKGGKYAITGPSAHR